MKKKLAIIVLCLCLLPFSAFNIDAAGAHWADTYYNYLTSQGIYITYNPGEFNLDTGITNGEVAYIAATMIKGNEKAAVQYTDVRPGDWCYDSVSKCLAYGIFDKNITSFYPSLQMSRVEVSKVFARLYSLSPDITGTYVFNDVSYIIPEYQGYIGALQRAGIVVGKGNGTFGPYDLVKRGEVAKMVYELITHFGYPTPRPVEVDKTALKAELDKAKSARTEYYSRREYDALKTAIANAQKVYDNRNATKEDVDSAIRELQNAQQYGYYSNNKYFYNVDRLLKDFKNDSRLVENWLDEYKDYSYRDWIRRGWESFAKYYSFKGQSEFEEYIDYYLRDYYKTRDRYDYNLKLSEYRDDPTRIISYYKSDIKSWLKKYDKNFTKTEKSEWLENGWNDFGKYIYYDFDDFKYYMEDDYDIFLKNIN